MEQSQDRCCLGQEAKNKYKVLLGNVMTNSTVHGLPNIRRAESVPKRIFWSISFLTAVGLFIGFSSTLIKHYFEYEVDVSVSVTFERDLAFPAVTICNLNPLRKSLLTEMQWTQLQGIVDYSRKNNRGEVASANGTFKNETGGNSSHQQSTDYNQWDNMDETFHTDPSPEWWMNKQIEEYLAQQDVSQRVHIGHQIDDMLITCRWSNRLCSPKNFTHHLDIMYGNCYTFNGGGKNAHISTNFAGPTHGLTLELFVEQDEYLDNLTHSAGIRVAIHPPGETPFPEDTGFDVEPGTLTSVGIRLGKTLRLAGPFSNCGLPRTSEHQNVFRGAYSVEACLQSCLLIYIAETCNCTDSRYPKPDGFDDIEHCQFENLENRKCKSNADMMYQTSKLPCDCPVKCITFSYTKEISSTLWPSLNSADYVHELMKSRSSKLKMLIDEQERTGQDLFGKNVLKLQVYFRDLTHEDIIQSQAYSEIDLVNDIGGNLGLWIGLSVLTIMEFVELIVDMFSILSFTRVSRGKRPQQDVEWGTDEDHNDDGVMYRSGEQELTSGDGDVYYSQRAHYNSDYGRQRGGPGVYYMQREIYLPNSVM